MNPTVRASSSRNLDRLLLLGLQDTARVLAGAFQPAR